tara:strand:- start:1059 stop:1895 length:837 start_codon:yes stop_codon:yes gene_type:complete
MNKKDWWRISCIVHINFEDTLIWKLSDLSINSYSINYLNKNSKFRELCIWLPKSIWNKDQISNLEKTFLRFFRSNSYKFSFFSYKSVDENYWLNNWKRYWNPTPIGKNFLILPSWLEISGKLYDKNIIKIDPGLAFGSGDHPSTSLCLEMMENESMFSKKILDIGCGSGILSIAAKKLGAGNISLIDNDYLSIKSTKENIALNFDNQKGFQIYYGTFNENINNFSSNNFDYIVCNIVAGVIKEIIPYTPKIINQNGKIIFSGIIASQKRRYYQIIKFI